MHCTVKLFCLLILTTLMIMPTRALTDDQEILETLSSEIQRLEQQINIQEHFIDELQHQMWVLRKQRGAQGEEGLPGLQGETGEEGEPGDMGDKGPVGEQGPLGNTGENGPDGELGPVGPPGQNGSNGSNGGRGPRGPADGCLLEYGTCPNGYQQRGNATMAFGRGGNGSRIVLCCRP